MTSTESVRARSSGNPVTSSVTSGLGQGVRQQGLDSNECLNLAVIIDSFSGPIKEEHAWAIIFECCQCLQKLTSASGEENLGPLFFVSSLAQVFIHKDGRIHESTFLKPHTSSGKTSSHYFGLLGLAIELIRYQSTRLRNRLG